MGWPPLILINYEGQSIGSMVNIGIGVSMARPYQSTLKYLDDKKCANPNAHVKVFNIAIRANGETFKEYIINAYNYTLRKTTSNWCHKYMLDFPNCILSDLTQVFCKRHQEIQNDEQIYMEFKNIKQKEIEWVEVYSKCIQKLAHGLQTLNTNNFLTTMFWVKL
jgi:hypothetical protein